MPKAVNLNQFMKQKLVGSGFMVGALLSACLCVYAMAQDAQDKPGTAVAPEVKPGDSPKSAAAPANHDEGKTEANGIVDKHSTGVDEVLKMMKAGVSTEVIKTYIENSEIAYNLSGADIIALKEHAVPDELATAMVKRGAALRGQGAQAGNLTLAAIGNNRSYRPLDPESYDYFQYYYLYPRTLASANQRLYSVNPPSFGYRPYSYGFYGPAPFHPLPPSAFRQQ